MAVLEAYVEVVEISVIILTLEVIPGIVLYNRVCNNSLFVVINVFVGDGSSKIYSST